MLGAGFSACMVVPVVQAADGKVTFAGELSEVTCVANVYSNLSDASTNQLEITGGIYVAAAKSNGGFLVLPEVRTQDLRTVGTIAKKTQFNIMFNGCSVSKRAISVHLTSVNANQNGRLKSTGTAQGVELVILNGSQGAVKVGFPSAEQNISAATSKTFAKGRPEAIPFYVGYYAAGPVKSGTVSAVLEYTFTYP